MVEVLLYVHRNRRFIRDGSPGRPPRLTQLLSSKQWDGLDMDFLFRSLVIVSCSLAKVARRTKERQPLPSSALCPCHTACPVMCVLEKGWKEETLFLTASQP